MFHDYNKPNNERIGRWLGPTIGADQGISYHILTDKGKVVSHSTVNHLPSKLDNDDDMSRKKEDFTKKMESLIGNYSKHIDDNIDTEDMYKTLFGIDEDMLDHDKMEFQELDENGHPISRLDLDHHLPNNDSLSVENNDRL